MRFRDTVQQCEKQQQNNMKVLFTVCGLLCFAGSVYTQNVTESCGANSTCNTDLECQDTKCRAKIDTACTVNSTTECVVTAARCPSGGKCACPTGSVASDKILCACTDTSKVINMDKTKCVPKNGQACTAQEGCLENGQCTNGTCACKPTYTPTANNAQCLKKVDETCDAAMKCLTNGECKDGKCMCMDKYAATFDMMKCRLLPGQACVNVGDCGVNAMCNTTTKICACNANYFNQEGKRCGKKVGASCSALKDCVPGAECKGDKCVCKNDFIKDDNDFCSGASAVAASVVLLVAALVSSRWI